MNTKLTVKILLIVAISWAFNAAALDVKQYNMMKKSKPSELCFYLHGLREGFNWAELMELKTNEKRSKFCVEGKINLNCGNFTDLLDDYIKTMKGTELSAPLVSDDMPIEPSFNYVLRKAYSCK